MNVKHRMENAPPTLRGARRVVTVLWLIYANPTYTLEPIVLWFTVFIEQLFIEHI